MTGIVETAGKTTEYICFGKGSRALVILPGLGLQRICRMEKSIEKAYQCFAEEYTVWVFDRINPMPRRYSIAQMADDAAEAMRALHITEANLFGASLGGMIAQTLAVRHPGRVRSLILGSTLARKNKQIAEMAQQWADCADARDGQALALMMLPKLYTAPVAKQLSTATEMMLAGVTDSDYERFSAQARTILAFDIFEELPQIRVPALVIGVEQDKVVTGEASHEIAEKLGCACYMYGSEYAHCAFDEAPDYKQRMRTWLESTYTG